MSDAWKAPGDSPAAEAAAKLQLGGNKPVARNPMDVATAVFEALKANPVGWFLAGVGYFGAILALVLFAISAIGLGIVPGVVLEDETVMIVGMIVGFAVYAAAIFGFTLVLTPLMNAAMMRGLAAERRGEDRIGLLTPFTGMFHGAGRIVLFNLIGQAMIFAGMLLFYVPGLVAAALVTFTLPIIVLEEDVSPTDALSRGWAHMVADPAWHLAQFAILFVMVLIAEFTIVGIFFLGPLMAAVPLYAYYAAHPEGSA